MTSGIYKITCLSNGRFYIGSAKSFRSRWTKHRNDLASGKHHNTHLQNAYNKYGVGCFIYDVIEECNNLIEREQYWIDTLNPEFNISRIAGSTAGHKNSPEHIEAMVSAVRGKRKSPETIAKMKLAQSNRSEETRRKLSEANSGKIMSEESRMKMSAAKIGRTLSEEHKNKIRESMLRKKAL